MNKKNLVMAFVICSFCLICTNVSFAMDPDVDRLADETNPFIMDGFVSISKDEESTIPGTDEMQNPNVSQDAYSSDEAEDLAEETDPFNNNGFYQNK